MFLHSTSKKPFRQRNELSVLIGNWEGGTIVGSDKQHILIHTERRKRLTITYDNGVTFTYHELTARDIDMDIYFAMKFFMKNLSNSKKDDVALENRIQLKNILTQWQGNLDSLDVELIIASVINRSREFVLTHPEYEVTKSQHEKIESLMKRRINHEPLAYLLGHREFFGLDFDVTQDTLIPRPETELMVEEILKCTTSESFKTGCIIDVGTGSGCIIISLANELLKNQASNTHSTFFGVDISQPALEVAKLNAKKHNLEKNITFTQSDLLKNISQEIIDKNFDSIIIAANLPYLSHTIYQSSMPDVQNFEPQSALLSEEDGLQHYRKLLEQIQTIRARNQSTLIKLFFEISPEQNIAIENLIREYFPQANIEIEKDLSAKYRLAITVL